MASSSKIYELDICTGSFLNPGNFEVHCDSTPESKRITDQLLQQGLITFLNPATPSFCYKTLINFWKSAKVADGKITATVNGENVVITPEALHKAIELPIDGEKDLNNIAFPQEEFWKEIALNAESLPNFGAKFSEIKPTFAHFGLVVAKLIEGKLGGIDSLTTQRGKLMHLIYKGDIKISWATYFFNKLVEQLDIEAKEESKAKQSKTGKKPKAKVSEFYMRKAFGIPLFYVLKSLGVPPVEPTVLHPNKVMFKPTSGSKRPATSTPPSVRRSKRGKSVVIKEPVIAKDSGHMFVDLTEIPVEVAPDVQVELVHVTGGDVNVEKSTEVVVVGGNESESAQVGTEKENLEMDVAGTSSPHTDILKEPTVEGDSILIDLIEQPAKVVAASEGETQSVVVAEKESVMVDTEQGNLEENVADTQSAHQEDVPVPTSLDTGKAPVEGEFGTRTLILEPIRNFDQFMAAEPMSIDAKISKFINLKLSRAEEIVERMDELMALEAWVCNLLKIDQLYEVFDTTKLWELVRKVKGSMPSSSNAGNDDDDDDHDDHHGMHDNDNDAPTDGDHFDNPSDLTLDDLMKIVTPEKSQGQATEDAEEIEEMVEELGGNEEDGSGQMSGADESSQPEETSPTEEFTTPNQSPTHSMATEVEDVPTPNPVCLDIVPFAHPSTQGNTDQRNPTSGQASGGNAGSAEQSNSGSGTGIPAEVFEEATAKFLSMLKHHSKCFEDISDLMRDGSTSIATKFQATTAYLNSQNEVVKQMQEDIVYLQTETKKMIRQLDQNEQNRFEELARRLGERVRVPLLSKFTDVETVVASHSSQLTEMKESLDRLVFISQANNKMLLSLISDAGADNAKKGEGQAKAVDSENRGKEKVTDQTPMERSRLSSRLRSSDSRRIDPRTEAEKIAKEFFQAWRDLYPNMSQESAWTDWVGRHERIYYPELGRIWREMKDQMRESAAKQRVNDEFKRVTTTLKHFRGVDERTAWKYFITLREANDKILKARERLRRCFADNLEGYHTLPDLQNLRKTGYFKHVPDLLTQEYWMSFFPDLNLKDPIGIQTTKFKKYKEALLRGDYD